MAICLINYIINTAQRMKNGVLFLKLVYKSQKMKKLYTLALFTVAALFTKAVVVKENLNINLTAQPQTENITLSPWAQALFQVDFFSNGALSIAGKNTNEFISEVAVKSVGGVNYTPLVIYNNQSVKSNVLWKTTPIFIYHPTLGFQSEFQGKGNQYMGARITFKATGTVYYMWFLVNLNEAGTGFTITKVAYEDDDNVDILTENEGSNQPTTGISLAKSLNASIFPNPARESFSIHQISGKYQVKLFNTNGAEVLSTSSINNDIISVAELPAGVYFVVITQNEATLTRKLIIE